jgi:hypothetical protein
MKNKTFVAPIICLLAGIVLTAKAGSWKAPSLPQGTTMKNGGTYYILNVGTGLFLTEEYNNWASRSIVGPVGLKFRPTLTKTLASGMSAYAMQDSSFVRGGWGNLSIEEIVVGNAIIMGASTIIGQPKYFWTIKESDKTDKTYTIQISEDDTSYGVGTAYEGSYLGYSESGDYEAINPTLNINDKSFSADNILWKFITPKDYQAYQVRMELYNMLNWAEKAGIGTTDAEAVYTKANAEEDLQRAALKLRKALKDNALQGVANATVASPQDATPLIVNPFFTTDHNGWELIGEVEGGNFGRWIARNVESYNAENFQCRQRIYLPAGVYRLGVEGFYRGGNLFTAENMHKMGTEQLNAYLFANNDSVPLKSIFSGASGSHTVKTGEQFSDTSFEAGDTVVLETVAATNYNANLRHGNFLNLESDVSIPTNLISETNQFEIVDARKRVNGHPTYYLRNLANGLYIQASKSRNNAIESGRADHAANFEIVSYAGNSAHVPTAKDKTPGLTGKSVMFKFTTPKGSPYPTLYLSCALEGMNCNLWNENDSWATWNMYRAIDVTTPKAVKAGKRTSFGCIPNSMSQARIYFDAKAYNNELMFYNPKTGPVTIGIKKPAYLTTDWTVFSDWSLTCYGNGEDAHQLLPKQ